MRIAAGFPNRRATETRNERLETAARRARRGALDHPGAGGGTRVSINGQPRGEVQGAVRRIWLGASPVSGTLKRGLLGG